MALNHPRSKRRYEILTGIFMAFRLEKWLVVQETLISSAMLWLAWNGIEPALSIFFAGVITTVSVSDLYRAYKELQAQNRDELVRE